MPDHQPRVTLADVARRAGVSAMTASYTYNRPQRVSAAARARVLAAASELGYAGPDPHARSLRRGRSGTIGVVLGEHLAYAFEDPQAAAFLAGVAATCAGHGFGLTILPITGAADDARRVHDAAVDGVIAWTTVDDDPVLAALAGGRRPAVVHGGWSRSRSGPDTSPPHLGIDDEAAARSIGRLAYAAARRPAVVGFPTDRERRAHVRSGPPTAAARVPFPVTRARLRGYRTAARAAGHQWADVPVATCAGNRADDGHQAARALLSHPHRPDAIAAMSDQLALGVLRAADDLGIDVPGELAVTGWDDDPVAARQDLTTVAQSLREQGAACAQYVLGVAPLADFSGAWSVVERGSTRGSA